MTTQQSEDHQMWRLRGELRNLQTQRRLDVMLMVVMLLPLAINLFTGKLDKSFQIVAGLCVLAGMFGYVVHRYGSRRLVCFVETTDIEPDPQIVACMLSAMSYPATRRQAGDKVLGTLPSLTPEQVRAVDIRLWRNLYAYAVQAPTEQEEMAFDIALLLSDKSAVPYLQRIVQSTTTPSGVRTRLNERLQALLDEVPRP